MQWVIVTTTVLLAVFTGMYVYLTLRLLRENEASRKALSQSEIFVTVTVKRSTFFLTVNNSGKMPARDISATFDPPFKLAHPRDHLLSHVQYVGLEPGQSRHYLLEKGLTTPRQYNVTIQWECILSGRRDITYPIDLDSWNHTVSRRIHTTRS